MPQSPITSHRSSRTIAADRGKIIVRSTNLPAGVLSGVPLSSHTWQCPPSHVQSRLPLAKVQAPLTIQPPFVGTARHGGWPLVKPKVNTARGSPKTSFATRGSRYAEAIEEPAVCATHQAALASPSAIAATTCA